MSGTRRERFEVGERPGIELNLPSGEATFLPGEPGQVEVLVEGRDAEEFVVERVGEKVVLRTPELLRSRWVSFDVTVQVPAGTDVAVQAASAGVEARVDLGSLAVEVASGDLQVGNVGGDAAVQSASGDVEIGVVSRNAAVNTASGGIQLRGVEGDGALNTASGDVRVGSALAALAVSTQSGDIEVRRYEGGDLECSSTSGDVRIGLPPGRALDVDINSVSGEIHSDFSTEPDGPPPSSVTPPTGSAATARLRVKTVSGDIALLRTDESRDPGSP